MLDKTPQNAGIRSAVEIITPARAAAILEKSKTKRINRRVTKFIVQNYAAQMKAGKWKVNGEAIILDWNGIPLDGQHRLHGCILADTPFETVVTYGADPESFDTLNSGRKRTAGDLLSIFSCKNAVAVAAAIRWVEGFRTKKPINNVVMSSADILVWWEKNPLIENSVARANLAGRFMGTGLAGALHYLFSERSPDDADRFFDDLASGAGLSATDSVFVLRERLLRPRGHKATLKREEIAALAVRAWNHRRSDKTESKVLRGLVRGKGGGAATPDIM